MPVKTQVRAIRAESGRPLIHKLHDLRLIASPIIEKWKTNMNFREKVLLLSLETFLFLFLLALFLEHLLIGLN